MLESSTLPWKRALIGPTLTETVAFISWSETFSSVSQPGMHERSTSGSLRAAKTASREAAMRRSSLRSKFQSCRVLAELLGRDAHPHPCEVLGRVDVADEGGTIDLDPEDVVRTPRYELAAPGVKLAIDDLGHEACWDDDRV